MFTIGILPDWTVNQFMAQFVLFVTWVLVHLEKMVVSFTIIFGLFLMVRFRERLLLATGMEHVTVIRWSWRDMLGFQVKKRPVEVFLWKVEGLHRKTSTGRF